MRGTAATVICLAVSWAFVTSATAQRRTSPGVPGGKGTAQTMRASGTFDVKLSPEALADTAAGKSLARLSINKQFHGDLEATSKGEMLSAGTSEPTSAGYVAIERVSGTLKGRKGTFVLQHSGTMTRGAPQLMISVVPDSGTDELAGLAGTMTITISNGNHSYEFTYTLADLPP